MSGTWTQGQKVCAASTSGRRSRERGLCGFRGKVTGVHRSHPRNLTARVSLQRTRAGGGREADKLLLNRKP